jgi:peptidoglycan/xylan/chitin deacetylase (PgdA/CDA1 family)
MKNTIAASRPKLFIKRVLGTVFKRVILRKSFFTNRYIILTYHRVRDEIMSEFEDGALWVTLKSFEMHLKEIREAFEMVPLSTMLSYPETKRGMCAITFDDGWKETYEVAFPMLKKLNCPATVFIPTALIGKNNPYWFDSLANLADAAAAINRDKLFLQHFRGLVPEWRGVELTGENLDKLIGLMKGLPGEILADEIDRGFEAVGVQRSNGRSIVNWGDIEEMRRSNIHFHSHGMRHYILPTLKADLKREEIFGSLEMLRKIGLAEQPVFSYPNGDWDDESIRLLVDAGYEGAVTTRLGLNSKKTNLFLMNRVDLHEAISNTPSLFWFRIFQAYLSGDEKGDPKIEQGRREL